LVKTFIEVIEALIDLMKILIEVVKTLIELMKTLIRFTIYPASMLTFPEPKPFPSLSSTLVNSPGRTGQHTL